MHIASFVVLVAGLLAGVAHAQPIVDVPGTDGRVTHAYWKPSGSVDRWIVSLHGTEGDARRDIAVWQKSLGGRPVGILAIQWWLGRGDAYLVPLEIYREIDNTMHKLEIPAGRALLHGFSRGSANLYAVAAIDQGRGRKLFPLYVASSGGVALDYPPTRAIDENRFGYRPLTGSRWVTACGDRDPYPDRDGCPAMRRTANWLREQGAQVVLAIEDPQSGHGALQLDPRNTARLMEQFLR